jgi:peptidoglycan-associated lipoprotein
MTPRIILPIVLALTLGALGACRRPPQSAPGTTPGTGTATITTTGGEQARLDSIAMADRNRRRADSLEAAARAAGATEFERQAAQAELSQALVQKIYFDYDQDLLRDESAANLDVKSAILLANPGVSLVITGHTDERGTSEYNLALGQRRAAQVKRYLVSKGVAEGRLATQSLGDSQPAVMGVDESAFQQNRRAEFEVRSPGGALVRPRS